MLNPASSAMQLCLASAADREVVCVFQRSGSAVYCRALCETLVETEQDPAACLAPDTSHKCSSSPDCPLLLLPSCGRPWCCRPCDHICLSEFCFFAGLVNAHRSTGARQINIASALVSGLFEMPDPEWCLQTPTSARQTLFAFLIVLKLSMCQQRFQLLGAESSLAA